MSGRHDLNMRPLRPERSALARLSYAPRESKLRILAIRPNRLNRNAYRQKWPKTPKAGEAATTTEIQAFRFTGHQIGEASRPIELVGLAGRRRHDPPIGHAAGGQIDRLFGRGQQGTAGRPPTAATQGGQGPVFGKSDQKRQAIGRVNDVGVKLPLLGPLESADIFNVVLHEQSAAPWPWPAMRSAARALAAARRAIATARADDRRAASEHRPGCDSERPLSALPEVE